ncbi:protein-L-isoaspartate(D-aspartate) O-methyltransferase [Barrientosiimonas humi]|uniref:Protein-L-isoaspartate O-methyltransferase n=1 Tax=Barrientosiimonas humi TaxID=999931 RepID=A0A542XCE4_9MICO|nr:methyltransferase domain-containing protein [Barrientosiimonas humi]TQL33510.1 protein-L-isoaspartate(D-aspartate) O-methyltransferase [Barrientosiimonas humi]
MAQRTPDAAIEAAMQRSPRARFLTPDQQANADLDRALPLMRGQTCSQPTTVRNLLRLLDVRPGQQVLDVGSGSGWTTALLASLVGDEGQVLGLELEPDLVEFGSRNLAATEQPQASIRQAEPGVLGAPAEGPWDRILVSAMAGELPASLVAQLASDGVLVIPVGGELLRVTDAGAEGHGPYLFVPLR